MRRELVSGRRHGENFISSLSPLSHGACVLTPEKSRFPDVVVVDALRFFLGEGTSSSSLSYERNKSGFKS